MFQEHGFNQDALFRTTFAKVIASGCDREFFNPIVIGAGMGVSQAGGNLVLTSGITANAETILRSQRPFKGVFDARLQTILSQRIANQQFYLEMVDVVGDGLAINVNSTTSVTVTIPRSTGYVFTAENVGQFIRIGAIAGIAGAIPGRYAIASVSGENVTFTVASWPASGSGTCSLFGWNYHQLFYDGTTATTAQYDTQRNGWNSGNTGVTINTSASPGHMALLSSDGLTAMVADQLVASNTGLQLTMRGSRAVNVPAANVQLVMQIRMVNLATAPATTTTWTVGTAMVEQLNASPVTLSAVRPQTFNHALPVAVLGGSATGGRVDVNVGSGQVGSSALQIQGTAAHDAVQAGNPVRIGARARTSNVTPVASDDVVDVVATTVGANVVRLGSIPELEFATAQTVTTNTQTAIRAAQGTGLRSHLTSLTFQNTNATATTLTIQDGSTTLLTINVPASMTLPAQLQFPTPLKSSANAALNYTAGTTGASVLLACQGYTAP